jgi:superoxide dismutase, Cu-Zn family
MQTRALVRLMLLATVALHGCGTEETRTVEFPATDTPATTPPVAPAPGVGTTAGEAMTIELIDRQGQRIGTAQLTETGQGVQIAIQASNLPPGPKGFHFHETGRCDPPAFQSAGDHFAPMGRQHGLENPQGPHAGDLPNLPVRPDGAADTTLVNPRVTLREGEPNSLLRNGGTALVIHAEQDDQRTDPSGNSGDRIACGVIARTAAGTTR